MRQRHRVGARAPVRADFEGNHRVAFGEIDVDELFELVADQDDRRLAPEMRGDAQLGLFAGGVARLVERHHHVVGRVGARRARPADVESDAGLFALGRLDVEAVAAPADLSADLRRRVGVDVDVSFGDPRRGLDRLVAPASVRIEPLVVVVDLVERPRDALASGERAVGRDGDRLEGRGLALAEAFVEILLDADRHPLGAHRQGYDAFDSPAAGLGDVDDDLRLERLGGRALGEVDGEIGVTLGVGLDLVGELLLDRGELVVGQAADEAGMARDRRAFDRLQAHRAGDVEAGRRRAVEEMRIERKVDRLARRRRRLSGLHGEVEALGDIIVEQEFGVPDAGRLGVGVGVDLPFAGHRVGDQRHGESAPAEPLIGDARALVFDAVRTLDHQRQRQTALGLALGVAQQRGDEHCLAGAIDAALGIEERVERAWRLAPGNAAIGQIEGALRQIEEAVIVVERRHQQARRGPAEPARQAGVEIDAPVGPGRLARQHFVVARDEAHFDAGERGGGGERPHRRAHPVVAREGGQAEVGDDHPLRRDGRVVPFVGGFAIRRRSAFPRTSGDEIDAGLQFADRLEKRKIGDDVLVEFGGDVHRAAPHLHAVLGLDLACPRGRDRLEEIVARSLGDEIAVADAVDVDGDLRRVDGGQRRAELALTRQHVGLAGEMRLRRTIAHVDFVIGRLEQTRRPPTAGPRGRRWRSARRA